MKNIIILTQEKDAIFVAQNILTFENGEIATENKSGELGYLLGKYENQKRCKEILLEIIAAANFDQIYKMPEK